MFEALIEGLGLIFQWDVLAYFALGCAIGILLGAVPGMGGAIGLVLVGIGTMVALNWDAISRSVGEGLDAQAERTQATLFRLGELMSISAEL